MVRGRGKVVRGGRGGRGRRFTNQHMREENAEETRRADREEEDDEDDSEEDSEESGEEESEDESEAEPATSSATAQPELSRTEKRELKRTRKQAEAEKQTFEAGDEDLINPNHVQEKMNISDLNTREPTRREREQKAKQDAKDRYWELHVQGKTDEAKADLSRLSKIRAERDAAQAKRRAEAEAKAKEAEARKKAQLAKRTT